MRTIIKSPMKGSANTTKALVRQSRNQGSLPFRNGTVTAVPSPIWMSLLYPKHFCTMRHVKWTRAPVSVSGAESMKRNRPLIGYKVEISYDPAAPETITVSYPGYEPFTTQPVRIGEFCDKNPTLPAAMQEQTPTTSRFLDAPGKETFGIDPPDGRCNLLCFLSEGGG